MGGGGTKRKEKIRVGSHLIVQAVCRRLFSDAIPLLLHTGTFACCVSALGRFVPLQSTWSSQPPPG